MEPVETVKDQLRQTQDVLVTSMEKLLARGETLAGLDEHSQQLSEAALGFQRRSVIVRRSMWWRQGRLLIALLALLALLLTFLYTLLRV